MTVLPRKTNFLAGTLMGASEGWRQGMEWTSFNKAYQDFLSAYQQRQPGGIQPNPMAVFGEPSQNPAMGGGMGTPQPQQNPIMRALSSLGQGMGGAGRSIAGGLQNLGQGIGNIGQNLGGMFGLNRRPNVLAGNPAGQMLGQSATGGIDPRTIMLLQKYLGFNQ